MGHFTNRGGDQQSVQKHIQLVLEIDAFITGEFKIRMIHFLLAVRTDIINLANGFPEVLNLL